MDTQDAQTLPPKRQQRFQSFKLEPGDFQLLEDLKAEHREILLMEGSYSERAARLNVAVGTIRSRLHRARAALEALRNGAPIVDSRVTQLS